MTKRGYIVVGPESSGTKLTAELLRTAGCRSVAIVGGDDGPELPLDGRPPLVRRSFPHGRQWWDVRALARLTPSDDVFVVVTTRDWFVTAESQVARELAPDYETAFRNIRRAYREIFEGIAALSLPFLFSSYESLVTYRGYAERLLAHLGLPPAAIQTYDGNEKWYTRG